MVAMLSAGLTTNFAPSRMHIRAVSGSSTVPAPIKMSGRSCARRRITSMAPGTVIVTSSTVTPPSAMALASANALSTDEARRTGTRPIFRSSASTSSLRILSPSKCSLVNSYELRVASLLALHARAAALHHSLHFVERGHGGVAGSGHRERAVSAAAVDRPVRALVVEEAVDQARGERVAT